MQKLRGKLKNTPRGTSLAPCSVNPVLNKEEYFKFTDVIKTFHFGSFVWGMR